MTRAIKWLLQHPSAALFLDPGLGKTGIVLSALRILFGKGMIERVLVVAPLRVCYSVWPEEVAKWTEFSHLTVAVAHGPKKEEALTSGAQILCINPEGLQWLMQAKNYKRLGADVLVVDESTRFKNTRSQRFRLIRNAVKRFRYRWILTGTPLANGYLDLFGQIFLIDDGRALGAYITHYRNQFFTSTGFGGYSWVLKPDADGEINKAIQPYALRLKAEDYIDLPEVVETTIQIDLPPKARKVYDQMENAAFTVVDGETFGAGHSAAALNKCRQIANGALYKDGSKDWVGLHSEKAKALESLLEERNGHCTLVAYQYEHDYKALEKHFGKELPRIGKGSATTDKALVRAWNAGELPVLLVHPQSVGHGLNMQSCPTADAIVWYGLSYDLELWDQLNRRLYRQGAAFKQMFLYRIIARDTVELAVIRALEGKHRKQSAFLDALKAYRAPKKV